MTTEEQLLAMQKEINVIRRRMRICIGAGALAVLWCGMASIKVPDAIKAHGFFAVDDQGNTRAVLGVDPSGTPVLGMYDTQGNARIGLGVNTDGTLGLVLTDAQKNKRAMLGMNADGAPKLGILDARGNCVWAAP